MIGGGGSTGAPSLPNLEKSAHVVRNKDIDRLRGLCIFLTLIHHREALLGSLSLTKVGQILDHFDFEIGVDIFFVISGYVVSLNLVPMLNRAIHEGGTAKVLKTFFRKRILRLWPASWFWVSITLMLSYLLPNYFGPITDNLKAALAVLFNLQDVYRSFPSHDMLGQYWSLSVEEKFYICYPFFLLSMRTAASRVLVLAVILCAFIFVRREYSPTFSSAHLLFNIRFDGIIWGILLYYFSKSTIYQAMRPRFLERFFLLNAIALMSLLILPMFAVEACISRRFAWSLASLLCVPPVWLVSYGRGYGVSWGLLNPLLDWSGSRSYSLYLCQYVVIASVLFIESVFSGLSWPFLISTALLGLALCAEFSFRFIETPFRSDRGSKRPSAPRAEASCLG